MTDYNDGKWHAWNGGKCPVHGARGYITYADGVKANGGREAPLGAFIWDKPLMFRVTKPAPPRPREMTAVWNAGRSCFEIHVTNIVIPHLTAMTVTGVLPE